MCACFSSFSFREGEWGSFTRPRGVAALSAALPFVVASSLARLASALEACFLSFPMTPSTSSMMYLRSFAARLSASKGTRTNGASTTSMLAAPAPLCFAPHALPASDDRRTDDGSPFLSLAALEPFNNFVT